MAIFTKNLVFDQLLKNFWLTKNFYFSIKIFCEIFLPPFVNENGYFESDLSVFTTFGALRAFVFAIRTSKYGTVSQKVVRKWPKNRAKNQNLEMALAAGA